MNLKQIERKAWLYIRRFLLLSFFLLSILVYIIELTNFSFVGRSEENGRKNQLAEPLLTEIMGKMTNRESATGSADNDEEEKNKVVILMWTNYYQSDAKSLHNALTSGKKWDPSCCDGVELTLDRSNLERATAVVFYHYFDNLNITDFPSTRSPTQLWVLYGKESPNFSPYLNEYNGLFNWTMSYRRDSDIWAPYGQSIEVNELPSEIEVNGHPLDQWIFGKSGLLTAVISHCSTPSKREDYIKQLREDGNIPVDVFGSCGRQICQRHITLCNHTAWWIKLASKYKFYFSGENSICVDYITEKFWRALEIGMVPVAYGGGNYIAEAPPGSFIDTRDFSSPQELAQYLIHLDENPEEYKKFFEWRRRYTVRTTDTWHAWCDLCKKVQKYTMKLDSNIPEYSNMSQVYSDLEGWWSKRPPPDMDVKVCSDPLQMKSTNNTSLQIK